MRDTTEMAREVYGAHTEWTGAPLDRLEQLVALVRADQDEKYEAIIASMTKLLEAQQKRESVAVDMIAAGIAAERARGQA